MRPNIVGAQAVRDGNATKASGVKVKGSKLSITLSKPDATFLSKITMPFFQALPTTLSRQNKVINVDSGHPLPSAGPYYVSDREPNRLVTIKKNPNYAKDVSRKYKRRPANLSQINIKTVDNLEASYQEVRANQADYTYDIPPTAPAELGREFGTTKGRFRVRAQLRQLHRDELRRNGLRRCVVQQQPEPPPRGQLRHQPQGDGRPVRRVCRQADRPVPARGFPGYKELGTKGYPNTSNVSRARTLANGHTKSGKWKYYYGLAAPGPQRMELVRSYLQQIGVNIDPQGFRGFAIYDAAGKRNSPHAFTTGGWCQDYSDPYDFINVLLYGGALQDENNNNLAYFNNAVYNKRMEQAAKLIGAKRLNTYAQLENDLVTKQVHGQLGTSRRTSSSSATRWTRRAWSTSRCTKRSRTTSWR